MSPWHNFVWRAVKMCGPALVTLAGVAVEGQQLANPLTLSVAAAR